MNASTQRPPRRRPRTPGDQSSPDHHRLLRLRYFHPRFWVTWLQIGTLRLLVALPQRSHDRVGAALGACGWLFAREARRVVVRNLELCFPELSAAQRRLLARQNFRHLGIGLIESGVAWWRPIEEITARFEIHGSEHLEAAEQRGRGVLLLTCHMVGLEISGARLGERFRLQALYREERNNPLLATFIRRARGRRIAGLIDNQDMRGLVRALRDGRTVWYAPDQNISPRRGGLFVPFFGLPAATTPAAARLAARTGCAVLPYVPQRHADGRYTLTIEPPLEPFPDGDPADATATINAVIERWIRAQPEQYFWAQKRFKTRPRGEPKRY